MSTAQAEFVLRTRNPDVLTCIANLSNDEVFTPPQFANTMLDSLEEAWAEGNDGANIWADKTITFLDPFTKSGVFLREIALRLIKGLERKIPDLQTRVDHILSEQVFGIGITYLTSMLARRSLYCSKFADGPHSVATCFNAEAGNVWFERTEHTWVGGTEWVYTADKDGNQIKKFTNGRCYFCGAGQTAFDRGDHLESHAYAFIHADNISARLSELFGADMQFDVVIGNPPYQLEDGGYGTSAAPIYQKFVEKAFDLNPRFVVMVTPSRWMAGGKGLDKFRERMLADTQLRSIVDYPKLYEAFPNVKIRGGVSYFLWSRGYDGPCEIQTMWDGEPVGPVVERFLNTYDVLVRRNEAVPILEKVQAKKESTLEQRVSSRKPFGLATNFKGSTSIAAMKQPVKLYANQRTDLIERAAINVNQPWIDEWKVLMTAVQGTSAAVETKFLSRPIVAEKGTACTETYLVAGHFATEQEAENYAKYLRTRFVRFLVSLRKATQHATRDVYSFVPDLPLTDEWTDAKLYARYGLSDVDIAFIESQVAEHDA